MYAWARNAPRLDLPTDVGFKATVYDIKTKKNGSKELFINDYYRQKLQYAVFLNHFDNID